MSQEEADAQLVLGHSTRAMTRRYVHGTIERTKEAVRRRGEASERRGVSPARAVRRVVLAVQARRIRPGATEV